MGKKLDYDRGHEKFLDYAAEIVNDPAFAGMPDIYGDGGWIQWEVPSNRLSGKFKDTNVKRRDWWRTKALTLNIDPETESNWLSRAAKSLHPTKQKPCKQCGLVLDIRYCYPNRLLFNRIKKLPYYNQSFQLNPVEHINELLERMVKAFGVQVLTDLPNLLTTTSIKVPRGAASSLTEWQQWIMEHYVPTEPSLLSPGVMSNAPDRFDGFHSLNRCCREKTDPGRSKENLRSYVTDRRAFEYWVDGDWVAADRLMGLVRADRVMREEPCMFGHEGPCDADHIGPISLGFVHRPEFQFLCGPCNSGKNNRLLLTDVRRLKSAESAGDTVISWYCKSAWDLCKDRVDSKETALRLSKVLRDNRHTYMHLLKRLADAGHYTWLTTYLRLDFADREVAFEGLRVEEHVTKYDRLQISRRESRYATEQKVRRLRVAFESLMEYHAKPARNAFVVSHPDIEAQIEDALAALDSVHPDVLAMNREIEAILSVAEVSEEQLRSIVQRLPGVCSRLPAMFLADVRLHRAMDLVGRSLAMMWSEDRYVRAVEVEE